jgi:hypothetical protein
MTHHPQHRRTTAIAGGALLAIIAVAATAATPATSRQPAQDVQKVAWSNDETKRPTDLDVGKKGASLGDRIVTRDCSSTPPARARSAATSARSSRSTHRRCSCRQP